MLQNPIYVSLWALNNRLGELRCSASTRVLIPSRGPSGFEFEPFVDRAALPLRHHGAHTHVHSRGFARSISIDAGSGIRRPGPPAQPLDHRSSLDSAWCHTVTFCLSGSLCGSMTT